MSFLQKITNPLLRSSGATAASAGIAAEAFSAAQVTAAPSTVFIELGTASQQANIARNGIQVPLVAIDQAALQNVLAGATPVVAKVVTQSIQPGVSVAKGTTVDLVLAEPSKLNVSVLQNAFQPLADQTLDAVFKNIVRDNPQVQSVLARNPSAAGLSAADTATLTTALANANAGVGTDPGHTIDAAFGTLQAAFAFGT